MLDFIVRHQEGLIIAIGTLVSALLLWVAFKDNVPPPVRSPTVKLSLDRGARLSYNSPDSFREGYSLRLPYERSEPTHAPPPRKSRKTIVLVFIAIVLWFLVRFIASLRPVPISAGLRLPEITHTRPGNVSLIIFLHGWNGDGVSTWKLFPALARADARFKHCDFLVIDYPTYFEHRDLNITDLSDFIGKSLESDLHVFERYQSVT